MSKRFPSLALLPLLITSAHGVESSGPQSVTLACYDTGVALVNEIRRVDLGTGDNDVWFRGLPDMLDPSSVALMPAGSRGSLDVREQTIAFDAGSPAALLRKQEGSPVSVQAPGSSAQGTLKGFLTGSDGSVAALMLAQADGSVSAVQLGAGDFSVTFAGAAKSAVFEPALRVQVASSGEGLQVVRLSYLTGGIRWRAAYEVVLQPDLGTAVLTCNVGLENRSGGSFSDARIRLVETERGSRGPLVPEAAEQRTWTAEAAALRYGYRGQEPVLERAISALIPLGAYDLPRSVTLPDGASKYAQLARVERLPVRRFHVYDGVRFDRFQRNRRNDWSYGTECHNEVETHLEFDNTAENGLGVPLPLGPIRLYEIGEGEVVTLQGEGHFLPVAPGGSGHVRLGPTRGLRGERERTGYTEVKPLHEYEETFEIRLSNDSDQAVDIRVVEHLYRWHDFEIIGADAEYKKTGPQTIEFRPELKPGGKRSLHYTVRYRW